MQCLDKRILPPHPHACFPVGVPGVVGGGRSEPRPAPRPPPPTIVILAAPVPVFTPCQALGQLNTLHAWLNLQTALGLEMGAVTNSHFSEQEMEAHGAVNSHWRWSLPHLPLVMRLPLGRPSPFLAKAAFDPQHSQG